MKSKRNSTRNVTFESDRKTRLEMKHINTSMEDLLRKLLMMAIGISLSSQTMKLKEFSEACSDVSSH